VSALWNCFNSGTSTVLGDRKFRCQVCKRLCNERTGTPFNFLEYPTDSVLLASLRSYVVLGHFSGIYNTFSDENSQISWKNRESPQGRMHNNPDRHMWESWHVVLHDVDTADASGDVTGVEGVG
jgi:hypothetical protein